MHGQANPGAIRSHDGDPQPVGPGLAPDLRIRYGLTGPRREQPVRPRFVYSVEFLPIGVWLMKSYVPVFLILERWFVSGLTMGAVR